MRFIVNKDKFEIEDIDEKYSGGINFYDVVISFDESWDDLIKVCRVIKKGDDIGSALAVQNDTVYFDRNSSGKYLVGFVGYTVEYNLTSDSSIDSSKTYYTRSGNAGSYIYTKVDNPVVGSIGTYYEATKTYQATTNLVIVEFKKGSGELEVEEDEIIPASSWEAYISRMEAIVAKTPYIGENGNWYIWNTSEYVDSGKSSKGDKGDKRRYWRERRQRR